MEVSPHNTLVIVSLYAWRVNFSELHIATHTHNAHTLTRLNNTIINMKVFTSTVLLALAVSAISAPIPQLQERGTLVAGPRIDGKWTVRRLHCFAADIKYESQPTAKFTMATLLTSRARIVS